VSYLSHTDDERRAMLDSIGIESVEDLFRDVPTSLRLKELPIPAGMSEPEVFTLLKGKATRNRDVESVLSFLGGGSYFGYVPAAVGAITGRAEFYTSYTPYQAEVSQGTLQVIYEFQTMIAALTGLDVANASLYDGATAVAEAAAMALNATGRDRIAILDSVHPEYREVLRTYANGIGYAIDEIPAIDWSDRSRIADRVTSEHAGLIAQSPDFFGRVTNFIPYAQAAHDAGALFISVADPVALALLQSAGEAGADICIGEGQNLGGALSFGGPYLGFIASTTKLQRRLPGRITGASLDNRGQRAFVLTLQTREQHIRREKATSNICTNEGLVALGATVYMALMGKEGMRKVANLGLQKAHYAARELGNIRGCELAFDAPFFREFALRTPMPASQLNKHLLEQGIIGGLDLSKQYPQEPALEHTMLLAFTDTTTREGIDRLVDAIRGASMSKSSSALAAGVAS
jgi:glycine dehydrogenase subunit 1